MRVGRGCQGSNRPLGCTRRRAGTTSRYRARRPSSTPQSRPAGGVAMRTWALTGAPWAGPASRPRPTRRQRHAAIACCAAARRHCRPRAFRWTWAAFGARGWARSSVKPRRPPAKICNWCTTAPQPSSYASCSPPRQLTPPRHPSLDAQAPGGSFADTMVHRSPTGLGVRPSLTAATGQPAQAPRGARHRGPEFWR